MLAIRLQRVGRKHEPVFRLVLTDSKNGPKSGKFLEILGSYDSRRGDSAVFKNERVLHWIGVGAQTSDTVNNLLVTRGIVKGEKRNVLSRRAQVKPVAVAETPIEPAPEPVTEEKVEEVV